MSILEKGRPAVHLKALLILFAITTTIGATSIHSQITSGTEPEWFDESRDVKYRELNEFAKFVEYKKMSERRDSILQRELAIKDSINGVLQQMVNRYQLEVVPNLQSQLSLSNERADSQLRVAEIEQTEVEEKLRRSKAKRFGLGVGVMYGYGQTIPSTDVSNIVGVGISLHYTLIRF